MRKKETAEVLKGSKQDILEATMDKINKGREHPILMRASDPRLVRGVISTGNIALDTVLGGGLVKGLSVEIYGSPGAGKTSAAVMMLKQAQLAEPNAVQLYFASESDIPRDYFEEHEIDMTNLFIVKPAKYAEESIDAIREAMNELRASYPVNMLVIDSVAALAPKAEVTKVDEQGLAAQDYALQAKMMSKLHRVISGSGSLSDGTIMILINQERAQIGQTPLPNTTPGGLASGFFCKLRMRLTCPKSEFFTRKDVEFLTQIDENAEWALHSAGEKDIVGHTVMVEITKLNTGRGKPHSKTSYRVIYGYGIDQYMPIIHTAMSLKIITVGGPYYSYKDEKYLGTNKLLAHLTENNLWGELKEEVSTRIKDLGERIRGTKIDQALLEVDESTGEILEEEPAEVTEE